MAWQQPLHRTILAVDLEGFGCPERSNPIRSRLREALYEVLSGALERSGIGPRRYALSDLGDGVLALVSPEVSKVVLLDPFIHELQAGLRDHNRAANAAGQLRLRVVVHAGEILQDAHGWSGQALNLAFRLLDADELRAALRRSSAHLALAVSEPIYREVVEHEWRGIHSAEYDRVTVKVKETHTQAWIYTPRRSGPHAHGQEPPPARSEPTTGRDGGAVTNIVHNAENVITGNIRVERDLLIGRRATDPRQADP